MVRVIIVFHHGESRVAEEVQLRGYRPTRYRRGAAVSVDVQPAYVSRAVNRLSFPSLAASIEVICGHCIDN